MIIYVGLLRMGAVVHLESAINHYNHFNNGLYVQTNSAPEKHTHHKVLSALM